MFYNQLHLCWALLALATDNRVSKDILHAFGSGWSEDDPPFQQIVDLNEIAMKTNILKHTQHFKHH